MTVLKQIGFTGCIVGFGLVLVAVAALSRAVLRARERQELLRRRFLESFEGRWLLVASRRGGWGDFVANNLLPVLPEGTAFVWFDGRSRVAEPVEAFPADALRLLELRQEKPYLVRVTSGRPEVKSLHSLLLPLARSAARSSQVQEQVRAIVADITSAA